MDCHNLEPYTCEQQHASPSYKDANGKDVNGRNNSDYRELKETVNAGKLGKQSVSFQKIFTEAGIQNTDNRDEDQFKYLKPFDTRSYRQDRVVSMLKGRRKLDRLVQSPLSCTPSKDLVTRKGQLLPDRLSWVTRYRMSCGSVDGVEKQPIPNSVLPFESLCSVPEDLFWIKHTQDPTLSQDRVDKQPVAGSILEFSLHDMKPSRESLPFSLRLPLSDIYYGFVCYRPFDLIDNEQFSTLRLSGPSTPIGAHPDCHQSCPVFNKSHLTIAMWSSVQRPTATVYHTTLQKSSCRFPERKSIRSRSVAYKTCSALFSSKFPGLQGHLLSEPDSSAPQPHSSLWSNKLRIATMSHHPTHCSFSGLTGRSNPKLYTLQDANRPANHVPNGFGGYDNSQESSGDSSDRNEGGPNNGELNNKEKKADSRLSRYSQDDLQDNPPEDTALLHDAVKPRKDASFDEAKASAGPTTTKITLRDKNSVAKPPDKSITVVISDSGYSSLVKSNQVDRPPEVTTNNGNQTSDIPGFLPGFLDIPCQAATNDCATSECTYHNSTVWGQQTPLDKNLFVCGSVACVQHKDASLELDFSHSVDYTVLQQLDNSTPELCGLRPVIQIFHSPYGEDF